MGEVLVMSLGLDESKAEDAEKTRAADALYNKLRIVWLAILITVIALFIVSRVVQPPAAGASPMLFWLLLALGVFNFGASFILKSIILKKSVETRKPEMVFSAYILALAMCESVALLGLVLHLAAGAQYYYLLFVLGSFGILLHKPQRDDVLSALAGGSVWESRKSK